jgi:hypothetical protein
MAQAQVESVKDTLLNDGARLESIGMKKTPFKQMPVCFVPVWVQKLYLQYLDEKEFKKKSHRQQCVFYGLVEKKVRQKQSEEERKRKRREYDRKRWAEKIKAIREAISTDTVNPEVSLKRMIEIEIASNIGGPEPEEE